MPTIIASIAGVDNVDEFETERRRSISAAIDRVLTRDQKARFTKLHRDYSAAAFYPALTLDECRRKQMAITEWRASVRELQHAFAIALGWQVGRYFALPQLSAGRIRRRREDYGWSAFGVMEGALLAFDHPTYFRERCRPYRPAGVVVHVYSLKPDPDHLQANRLAAIYGLEYVSMPWSWYYPGGCLGGLYLRRASR